MWAWVPPGDLSRLGPSATLPQDGPWGEYLQRAGVTLEGAVGLSECEGGWRERTRSGWDVEGGAVGERRAFQLGCVHRPAAFTTRCALLLLRGSSPQPSPASPPALPPPRPISVPAPPHHIPIITLWPPSCRDLCHCQCSPPSPPAETICSSRSLSLGDGGPR